MHCALATIVALGLLPALADKEGVREIAVEKATPAVEIGKPTVIKNRDDLAKVFKDEDERKAIAAKIDFAKDQLLVFPWSGNSKWVHEIVKDKDNHRVVFEYKEGPMLGLKLHYAFFVLPASAKWTVK